MQEQYTPNYPAFVQLKKFAADHGYTEKALRMKIERGVLICGKHYIKADRHVMIVTEEFYKWLNGK